MIFKYFWREKIAAVTLFSSALPMLVAGCASYTGEPQRVYSTSEQLQFVKKTFGQPDFASYFALSSEQRRSYRNEYVLAQIYAIDLNYGNYERDLTQELQRVGFASTVTNLALTSVASQIASTAAKDVLTATATGLTGAKAAYDKDILIGRAIPIIQSQMRASRAKVATKIYTSLGRSADEYPLMMAWIDLQALYKAGTLTDGLLDASQRVGAEAIAASDARDYVTITALPSTDQRVTSARDFLYPEGTFSAARAAYLDSLMVNAKHRAFTYLTSESQNFPVVAAELRACMEAFGSAAQCKPGSIQVL